MHTPSADPYRPQPVPPAQQLGAGWPQPAPGRVLRQAQAEVTVLLGRLLAVPKPGFDWTGDFVPLLTPGSVLPVTSFHASVIIQPASFSQKMSQESPSHCLILPRGHFRQTSSLLPPSQR